MEKKSRFIAHFDGVIPVGSKWCFSQKGVFEEKGILTEETKSIEFKIAKKVDTSSPFSLSITDSRDNPLEPLKLVQVDGGIIIIDNIGVRIDAFADAKEFNPKDSRSV